MRCTVRRDRRLAFAIARPVQCVAAPGGSLQVKATTRRTTASGVGALPGFLVLSRSNPSTPSSAKRCCQRHTAGRVAPLRWATWRTGRRSAEPRMMRARWACFCGRLRSAMIAAKRAILSRNQRTNGLCHARTIAHASAYVNLVNTSVL